MASYSGRSLTQKLGIKPGFCIFTVGLSGAYDAIVGQLPADLTIVPRLNAPLDMVHLFVSEAAGLAKKLGVCCDAIPQGFARSRSKP